VRVRRLTRRQSRNASSGNGIISVSGHFVGAVPAELSDNGRASARLPRLHQDAEQGSSIAPQVLVVLYHLGEAVPGTRSSGKAALD
jgi:hypothetical protein